MQESGESISTFSARLRRKAGTCNFGTHLGRALRDQFISGVRQSSTKKKLLDKDRTFDECIKIALAEEVATREVEYLNHGYSKWR